MGWSNLGGWSRRGWKRPAIISGFTPASLSGLVGWYDASDAASITQSGGLVSQWNDKSGNARHMTQATGTAQPTYGATSFNGSYPGLTFDGSTDFMGTTFSVTSASWSCFVVMKINTVTSFARIISLVSPAGAPAGHDENAANVYALLLTNGTNLVSYYSGSQRGSLALPATNTAPFIGASVNDGANNKIYVAGVAGTPSALAATAFNPGGMVFGVAAGAYFNGILSEVIVTTGDQSANIAAINSYLAAKWGL